MAHAFVHGVRQSYGQEMSNGLDHAVDGPEILKVQHGIMTALSKFCGFAFWSILAPRGDLLPEAQERRLLGRSPGYLSVLRRQKEAALNCCGDCVKDYTDSFSESVDIFDMYADSDHLTDRGNAIVAKRCAKDILRAFGGREYA
jgi:hypothetical protein